MTRSSAIATLHPGTPRFRMVAGRPRPSEQRRGGSCYMMPGLHARAWLVRPGDRAFGRAPGQAVRRCAGVGGAPGPPQHQHARGHARSLAGGHPRRAVWCDLPPRPADPGRNARRGWDGDRVGRRRAVPGRAARFVLGARRAPRAQAGADHARAAPRCRGDARADLVVLRRIESLGARSLPTPLRCAALRAHFDRIFMRNTNYAILDRLLARLHRRKSELLRILQRPEIPLHTNGSENDIRACVTKRKIRQHHEHGRTHGARRHAWPDEDLQQARRLVLPLPRRPPACPRCHRHPATSGPRPSGRNPGLIARGSAPVPRGLARASKAACSGKPGDGPDTPTAASASNGGTVPDALRIMALTVATAATLSPWGLSRSWGVRTEAI